MIRNMMAAVALGLAVSLAAPGSAAMATEQAPYAVVQAEGRIEIRDYPELLTALTVEPGDRRASDDDAFRRLAAYIFDDERPEGEIAMTAPVFMAPEAQNSTSMEFVMPKRFTRETLPEPKDPGVSITERPARRVAAIRFSGWAGDDDLAEREAELRAWMAAQGLEARGEAEWAFYNPPWTLGPWRRNEVLIEIEG
ncbi:MAG: heme-binding protein [Pseudomonadota bacterium]